MITYLLPNHAADIFVTPSSPAPTCHTHKFEYFFFIVRGKARHPCSLGRLYYYCDRLMRVESRRSPRGDEERAREPQRAIYRTGLDWTSNPIGAAPIIAANSGAKIKTLRSGCPAGEGVWEGEWEKVKSCCQGLFVSRDDGE